MDEKLGEHGTRREHFQSVERQTGKRPKELDGPELPYYAKHVFDWFNDLRYMVVGGGFGPSRISPSEYVYWQELEGIKLEGWEYKAMKALDTFWLAGQLKVKPKTGENNG